jgi:hypothetical protein
MAMRRLWFEVMLALGLGIATLVNVADYGEQMIAIVGEDARTVAVVHVEHPVHEPEKTNPRVVVRAPLQVQSALEETLLGPESAAASMRNACTMGNQPTT